MYEISHLIVYDIPGPHLYICLNLDTERYDIPRPLLIVYLHVKIAIGRNTFSALICMLPFKIGSKINNL